jgi:polyhydroxybutyrate depolymerase
MNPLLILLLFLTTTRVSYAQWDGQTPPNEVPIYLPSDYDPSEEFPLVIFLHGYAPLTTAWYDILLPLQKDANTKGYIFAKPDGSQDGLGEFYWAATDACCDMWGNEPDHVGYLLALVESIQEKYNIDPRRIHLIGHSNGGFMCHRMACEAPEKFASVVSISGAMWFDPSNCQPKAPIHVLNIHGTFDPIILWTGGLIGLTPYPGANYSTEYWAAHNGCSTNATNGGSFDFDWFILFNETTRWIYEGCDDSQAGSAELWQVTTAGHFPAISSEGIDALFDYLDTHTNPSQSCNADLNEDGNVNVADVLFMLGEWGESDSSADLNTDNTVDISDLLILIGAWGPCK